MNEEILKRIMEENLRNFPPTYRSITRIEPLLEELRKAWLSAPNQRLGQLMENLGISGFFVEDDKALEILKKYNESGHHLITKD